MKQQQKTKKTKEKLKPAGRWREFVRFLMETNKGVPLKTLLKNYKKTDYQKFCKNHCVHY